MKFIKENATWLLTILCFGATIGVGLANLVISVKGNDVVFETTSHAIEAAKESR